MHIDGGWIVESVSFRTHLYAQLFSVSPQKLINFSPVSKVLYKSVDAKAPQFNSRLKAMSFRETSKQTRFKFSVMLKFLIFNKW